MLVVTRVNDPKPKPIVSDYSKGKSTKSGKVTSTKPVSMADAATKQLMGGK